MELDNQSPETIEYKAISGEFGEVRYFITTLDQSDAVENIRFADEIQGSWSFSERVQRKLDENRANTDIFSYLVQGGIRFFNSILIKRTKEKVSNEVSWNEVLISNCRKEFHVILPEVDFIDEQIKESSESDDSFAEVRDLLDSSEEDEEESYEIEDDEDIFKETEEVKD
ncbi:DNA sulfur modification protein DndB [Nostoc sp.]|uniref:DNA sulfur modification protein DndB n=1 Tax=Nostoc sp. TaxID=1180 RepID=UPI002FF92AC1